MRRTLIPLTTLFLLSTTALAAGLQSPTDLTNPTGQNTPVKYNGVGNQVYELEVPALLRPSGSGNVKLHGTWDSKTTIKVDVEDTIVMTNNIDGGEKVLTVTFNDIRKVGDNTVPVESEEIISIEEITDALFGTWNGVVNYKVSIDKDTVEETVDIIDKTTTYMQADLYRSKQEANEHFLDMIFDNYTSFGILVEDLSMISTKASEYKALSPAILNLEIDSITHYQNGYVIQFKNIETMRVDAKLAHAVLTNDTSRLNSEELSAYNTMMSMVNSLDLANKSDIDKIQAIHDALILRTAYSTSGTYAVRPAEHSAVGLFNNGIAVCDGYSSAFRLMCYTQGINCGYVWSDSGNHSWNLVELNGKWYHIDITWDDPVPDVEGRVVYDNFMMTDADIAKLDQHQDWKCECGKTHVCTDSSYRLYPYREYICNNDADLEEVILKQQDIKKLKIIYSNNFTEEEILTKYVTITGGVNTIEYIPSQSLTEDYKLITIIQYGKGN